MDRSMAKAQRGPLCVGIFVGGRGLRLGGVAKGNLALPSGEKLAERLVALCEKSLPDAPVVLVGAAEAYAALGLPALADAPAGVGPLGGLRALLLHAEALGCAHALALSCDLPYLGASLLSRLAEEAPEAACLAPREGELWQTLVARYCVGSLPELDATLAAGDRALQRFVARLGARAVELRVDAGERAQLRDWDTPADAPA
jgi:molybdopterin-guanine dinucleotide biosynthesis protein A